MVYDLSQTNTWNKGKGVCLSESVYINFIFKDYSTTLDTKHHVKILILQLFYLKYHHAVY